MLERWILLAVAAAGLALGFWTRAAARRNRAREAVDATRTKARYPPDMASTKNPHVSPEETDRPEGPVNPEPELPPDGPIREMPERAREDDPRRRATVRERKAVR